MEESDSSSSISLTNEQTQTILEQANKGLCLIKTESSEGSGFFCLVPYKPDRSKYKIYNTQIVTNYFF